MECSLTTSPEIKIPNMQKTPKPECKMTQNRFRELLKLSRLIKILSFWFFTFILFPKRISSFHSLATIYVYQLIFIYIWSILNKPPKSNHLLHAKFGLISCKCSKFSHFLQNMTIAVFLQPCFSENTGLSLSVFKMIAFGYLVIHFMCHT